MSKGLIVVESPAKASTISKFLKNQYSVKASMGHVRDLPAHDLGVNVAKDFAPSYVTDKKKSKIISELKEAAKSADAIYLASDHDREGEAIAWHLSKVMEKEIKGKPCIVLFSTRSLRRPSSAPSKLPVRSIWPRWMPNRPVACWIVWWVTAYPRSCGK
ncbi:MAG: toprim domain-containing protein [Candidatus Cloacimonetes bacterium]|nr:toprim domain-containing protein [Candidatus Cloacimonadota bacterium]